MFDYLHPLSGLLVGIIVGLTGVGGGSLMAPIMILLLGVAPATAVGTDLWFAAITKMVGSGMHHGRGTIDWMVVRRLAYGSIPGVIVMLIVMHYSGMAQMKTGAIPNALGLVLILTAVVTIFRQRLQQASLRYTRGRTVLVSRWQLPMTILCGAILGVMVTLTSVGAGALGTTMIMMLYPLRMETRAIVGTDIGHAVPLTLLAGIGHLWMGNVNPALLGSLLIGSIPGIIIGTMLGGWVPDRALRIMLAIVLAVVGFRLVTF